MTGSSYTPIQNRAEAGFNRLSNRCPGVEMNLVARNKSPVLLPRGSPQGAAAGHLHESSAYENGDVTDHPYERSVKPVTLGAGVGIIEDTDCCQTHPAHRMRQSRPALYYNWQAGRSYQGMRRVGQSMGRVCRQ